MKKNSMLTQVFMPILKSRARRFGKMISPHVAENSKVLDMGTGNMLILDYISKQNKVEVQGLDVVNMNLTELPHQLYDGKRIPFEDNTFDITLFTFVLHHIHTQLNVFEDALRVTKSKVIVFEDTYKNKLEHLMTKLTDIPGNIIEEPKMNFALNFRNENEWEEIFRNYNLKIIFKKTIFNPIKMGHHTLYVLEK